MIELTERQQMHDLERVRVAARHLPSRRHPLRRRRHRRRQLRPAAPHRDPLRHRQGRPRRSSSAARPSGQSSAVLGSVVEFAARTGALVIAEGIEHEAQLGAARRLGITAGQGYSSAGRGRSIARLQRRRPPSRRAGGRRGRLAPVDRPGQLRQLSAARSSRPAASTTRSRSSAGPSPAASHTIRGSRRNQVSCRLAYWRVRRAVTAIGLLQVHSPAR